MKDKEYFFISNSPEETKVLAKKIIEENKKKILKNGLTLLLKGNLGSGKTTFTQKLGEELKIKKVNSPTFVIQKKYQNQQKIELIHIDCYRLEKYKELKELEFEENINKKNKIIIVEWPEIIPLKIKKAIKNIIKLDFSHISEDQRKIKISEK